MRRTWIMLLAIATALVIALPAGAAVDCGNEKFANHPQCQGPSEPPRPPTAVPIAVSIDAEPMYVHEADDLIHYKVMLENKTGDNISGVQVLFTTSTGEYPNPVVDWEFPDDAREGVVPANSSVWMKFYLHVGQFTEAQNCANGDECFLLATAEVLVYNEDSDAYELVTQTEMSMLLIPEPACGFEETYDDEWESDSVTMNGLCIWTLPEEAPGKIKTGVWEITLKPILPYPEARKPSGAWMDVRDGVPGNWCTLAIGDSWGFSDRWKAPYPSDPTLTGHVYLPGVENLPIDEGDLGYPTPGLDEGMCISGGAGGDYFKVGNPRAFYLRADGDVPVNVTVKWVSEGP